MNKPKIIVILGPTGSGKSELAVRLAQEFNGEIISADSRQIYKGMDIGTGKIRGSWKKVEKLREENFKNINDKKKYVIFRGREKKQSKLFISQNLVHHLIDFLTPDKSYSAEEFKQAADELINEISRRGKLPILAGGTAQYIYAVVDNWTIPEVGPNKTLRNNLEKLVQERGSKTLWEMLKEKDPEAADFVQPDNPRRIIRALEVIEATGEKFSKLRKKKTPLNDSLLIGLKIPRTKLYKKIDQRVDQMIADGLIKEVKKLMKKYGAKSILSKTFGYQEIASYLQGEISKPEAIQKIKFNHHLLVRHQNTWFKRDKRIKWVEDYEQAERLVKEFLNDLN